MIDTSSSMRDDQAKLREQLPQLAETLLTSSRGPVRDLHIAVVNSDMGASDLDSCSEHGADGLFQHAAQGPMCSESYPPFLRYLALPDASPDMLANDLACIANLGTEGCSREQPLEAALKALWPAANPQLEFVGGPSHGDRENAGFLRSDPGEGLSLFAVVVISDEDDSSPFPISRYVEGFKGLRPGNEALALFSAIVSVPPELVDAAARSDVDFDDANQRDAYYDRILNDPRMQSTSDASAEPAAGSAGRRYVELAKALGTRAALTAIDQDDYSPALDFVTEIVGMQLDALCIPEALPRNADGTIACNVIWELPPERLNFDTPIECTDRPEFLSSLSGRGEAGGKRCLVKQHAASAEAPVSSGREGWYYDDFSDQIASTCGPRALQRAAFTPAASPPTGVTVTLECWTHAERERTACE